MARGAGHTRARRVAEGDPGEVDCLVLSPHLDDAAFSLGAGLWQLARKGGRVLVVTLATAEPTGPLSAIAQDLHRRWGLKGNVVKHRRQEDNQACAELGVETLHLGLADALYRTDAEGEALYPSFRSLFGNPHDADRQWREDLAERLRRLPVAQRVCVPLGAGHHVDHQLTRRAAEEAFGSDLLYYEDFPYARKRWVRWKAMGRPWAWRSEVWPAPEEALRAKVRAIGFYDSQLGTAFASLDDMERQVRAFAAQRGGERLWRRR